MRYELDGREVGWGDDVLQLFDSAAGHEVGRHRQTEALVRGEEPAARALVCDRDHQTREEGEVHGAQAHAGKRVHEARIEPRGHKHEVWLVCEQCRDNDVTHGQGICANATPRGKWDVDHIATTGLNPTSTKGVQTVLVQTHE